jgi:hypothetical protein
LSFSANTILVYPQRFTAHLWNNIRSSRLRLNQVILRQCHLWLSSSLPQDEQFLSALKAESEANIIYFALEISATVPQLGGYLELVKSRADVQDINASARAPETTTPPETASELLHRPKQMCSSIAENRADILSDQPTTIETTRTTQEISVFYSRLNDNEIKVDAPAQIAPLIEGPQPASIYHMLFQLYSLRSISILPAPFKAWIRDRIQWLEYRTDADDLTRLQEMVIKRPGDGFPVEDQG